MGIPATGQTDQARVVSGVLAGTTAANLGPWGGGFNVSVWGTWTGTIAIERSFDGGTTWLNCTLPSGAANSWSTNFSIVVTEPELGVLYRLNPNIASGTASYRASGN